MALIHLFKMAEVECAIAHCNFQLRGAESIADEEFVRSLAASLEIPVYVKRMEVEAHARDRQMSHQMAARELRYAWFESLRKEHGFHAVATAHNLNDSVETFFINLSRGTGLRGLTGIPVINGSVIRPLLFASRNEIVAFCEREHIHYREDSTNRETKYRRNKIRHDVIPIMQAVQPAFTEVMESNMQRLSDAEAIFRSAIEQVRSSLFEEGPQSVIVEIEQLRALTPLQTWLYELFSPYGFTRMQIEGIVQMMDASPGKQSISTTHKLHKDRDTLILTQTTPERFDRFYLDRAEQPSNLPFPMDVEILKRDQLESIPADPTVACLDLDQLDFPLTIRHWLHGDYFHPLGMDGVKKLSDFFIDQKIPGPEKERTWILASGKKIVWIMGHRIDHRYRITDTTRKVLKLSLHPDVGA